MRSRALASGGGRVRLALNVPALGGDVSGPATAQHVAFGCRDIVARRPRCANGRCPSCRSRGTTTTTWTPAGSWTRPCWRPCGTFGILYDRDEGGGELFHLYTGMLGHRLFLEVVQRAGGYDGYGEDNAPVRAAAQLAAGNGGARGRPRGGRNPRHVQA